MAETKSALQRIREMYENGELDEGLQISPEAFEELRDALDSTLIDGEQVLSPTAEAILTERIRQVKDLGRSPGDDENKLIDLIMAGMAHAQAAITPLAYIGTPPSVYPWSNWRQRTTEEHLLISGALIAAAGDAEAWR